MSHSLLGLLLFSFFSPGLSHSIPVFLAALNSDLCLCCPTRLLSLFRLYFPELWFGKCPEEEIWGLCVVYFASFLSKTIALQWLLSSACKQLLYMFCLDFILVYNKKLSPIIATPSWIKLDLDHVIFYFSLYHLLRLRHLYSTISVIKT